MTRDPSPWLFSRRIDLLAFGGSFALAMIALAIGAALGDPSLADTTPTWAWVPAVLLVDVAHVWATIFRTYADPAELRAHAARYTIVPALALVAGHALYVAGGAPLFWRVLAYLAIVHFVRQQYGWVALYRARAGEPRRGPGWALDAITVYLATIYPLAFWHAHLPRRFAWFVPGDLAALPARVGDAAVPVLRIAWAAALFAYALRAVMAYARANGRRAAPGKDLVVVTTAVAWYVGIVAIDSDYAFTVTNVLVHGVPYFVLVFAYWKRRAPARAVTRSPLAFVAVLWLLAYVEELLWDRAVWRERPSLFGAPFDADLADAAASWIVPLLAVPQATHYALDAFVWRRGERAAAGVSAPPQSSPASSRSARAFAR